MPKDKDPARRATQIEAADLVKAAADIAGFRMPKREYATARNISGIRTATMTFSRRLDSRTVFATDNRYGHLGRAGTWTGADRPILARCRQMIRAAGVPAGEIAGMTVVPEFGAVAERVSDTEFRQGEPHLLRKLVQARRAVSGIPVWNSYARLGLTAKGDVGVFELHWPHLAPSTVREAELLVAMVKRGFEPPRLPGARLESVEAGVIHSRAIGFFMDTAAAIRAIYIGEDPALGRKPALYLDRHGEHVVLPRDVLLPMPEQREPRPPP